jgi:hypothetical protein
MSALSRVLIGNPLSQAGASDSNSVQAFRGAISLAGGAVLSAIAYSATGDQAGQNLTLKGKIARAISVALPAIALGALAAVDLSHVSE